MAPATPSRCHCCFNLGYFLAGYLLLDTFARYWLVDTFCWIFVARSAGNPNPVLTNLYIPPDWAFPAAWFTLWTLQAIALVLLLASDRAGRTTAIGLLALQFVVAILWQSVVFGPGRLHLAAWWLVAVLVLVVGATVTAWRVSPTAGALIAPTIVWVSVATVLGFSLLRLNPGA